VPVTIAAIAGADTAYLHAEFNAPCQTLSFALAKPADRIVIDPQNWILETQQAIGFDDFDENCSAVPREFALKPLYRNPFSVKDGNLNIDFSLEATAEVKLFVYDITGRRVREIFRGRLPAGDHHRRVWDGRDDGGKLVAAGVYLFMLDAGGSATATQKVVLVR
jgi:hypothetical protein